MLSEFTFLRIYKSLANGKVETKEILGLYSYLQAILGEDTPFAKWFKEESPDRLGAAIAIDAVAHAIHQDGEDTLHQIFPDAEYSIIKSELDKLAGLEKNSQIRRYNRGYFTTLLAEDSVFLLEKQLTQVGRTTREAILPAIKEYEKLYKAGLSSPAEILTLSRYYPDNEQYRATIIKLGLDNEDNHPVVVGGPASVEMIDREGHLITTEALDKAFTKFMANFRARDLNILHSDVQVGWVLPTYITKDGRVFSSGVDDKQLWVLSELRGDTRIAKRVAQEILDKNLRSYSIAGSALDVQDMQKGVNTFKQVNELEISEITLCLVPNTQIWTKVGLRNIAELKIGEFVYTHESRYRPVVEKFERNYDGKIFKVFFKEGLSISATPEHPIRTVEFDFNFSPAKHIYSWTEIKMLKIGDIVSTIGDHLSEIASIEEIDYSGKVYNMEVEEDHSYTTEACVVKNCERGMNQGSNFDLIKSVDSTPSLDSILSSFQDELSPFSGAQIYVENSGEIPSVIIKADKYNSIIDMLILELQKMLPENTSVVVKYDVSDAIPIYKMQLVPIWTTPQTQREADHSFPAKLGEDIIIKESNKSYEEESEEINESKKTEKARNPHKFTAAEWTHKNGHPRCKICGMEEGMIKICPGLDKENLQKMIVKDAEQGTPPRPGLVPQSGDPKHPGRWVRQTFESKTETDIWNPLSNKFVSRAIKPKRSMHGGRTWDTIKVRTPAGEKDGYVDTTWGHFIYWEHENKWYKTPVSAADSSLYELDLTKGETQNMGKAIDMFKSWLRKEKELDSPGRKVLHDFAGRQSKLRQLLDEQGMPEDEDPKDANKRREKDVAELNPQPWLVSEAGEPDGAELTPSEKADARGEHKITRFDN